MTDMRIEKDAIGELEVPANVYWGINTQRAIQNFKISGKTMPHMLLLALAQVKKACLEINSKEGLIEQELVPAIIHSVQNLPTWQHVRSHLSD